MFSSIKRNHFIILSVKDVQWHIVITTWKPQQLQWMNSLHVCISTWWLVYYCKVVLLLCTCWLPVIYFPMQRWFPNLQKQKVLFNVRFDVRAIWKNIKDVSSVLREHKLVSSAMCKMFSMDHYFEREWDHFIFSLVLKHLKTLEENTIFFIILKLQFGTISLSKNILVLFYKIEALNYF